ncbi:hypothetical protein LCGC14_0316320 [marine sediment metagenome]|uniref:Uncharacterized protein n=1 Tax=marine sediment metagenome TaxID=412755 RepID=A0A0F9TKF9_9ZZZZ
MRQILLSATVVGMGLAFLYLFYQILTSGKVYFHEPNPVILWAEIVVIGILTGFGLYMFIKIIRRKKMSKHPIKKPHKPRK